MYVSVPQAYAHLVKTGQTVTIRQTELAGKEFKGTIARTAGAIDPATRTMQVEVTLSNKDGALMPGAYVRVEFPLKAAETLAIPGNTLLIRAEGNRVATVDAEGRVKLVPVQLGRNLGQVIEVLSGVGPDDRLIVNPADSLNDGDQVQIAAAKPAAKSEGKSAAKNEPPRPSRPAPTGGQENLGRPGVSLKAE